MTARMTGNRTGAELSKIVADGVDLSAPGGLDALFAAHRATFGDARMEANDDDNDDSNDAGNDDDRLGLFDDDDANDDDQEDTDDGDGDTVTVSRDDLAAMIESAVDRRLNTRRMRNQNGGQGSGSGRGGRPNTPERSGIDPADTREARASYRESIGDHIKFLGAAERDHARAIAENAIREGLERGEDPDRIGRDVARTVGSEVSALRALYEKRAVSKLRSKGLLVETGSTGGGSSTGQPVNSGRTKSGTSTTAWSAGQNRAANMGRSKSKNN